MKPLLRRTPLGLACLGLLLLAGCGDSSLTTTASGLQYKDLEVGTGPTAKKDDLVEVHYTGTFRDGRVFDSSYDGNYPFQFQIGRSGVIQGWHEGVQGMKVGGKRKLVIPSKLAYGEQGSQKRPGEPQAIPPNTDLTFEIELLGIYTSQSGGLYV